MGVIVDVIFAVAEVAVAPGAVTEFQFRVAGIGSAANCTAMRVGNGGLLAAAPGERNRSGLIGRCLFLLSTDDSKAPGGRQYVDHISATEDEVVQKSH